MKRAEYCPFCGETGIMQNADASYDCYRCRVRFHLSDSEIEDTRTPEEKILESFDL